MLVMGISSLVICGVGLYLASRFGMSKMKWWVRLLWIVGTTSLTFITGFAGFAVANNIAYQAAISGYHQFLNGTVIAADVREVQCERDGTCSFDYNCDPYIYTWITYDDEGNAEFHSEIRYHSCPYVTVEYLYSTKDSIGNTTDLGRTINSEPVEWRAGEGIPDSIPRGSPEPWQLARDALDAGRGLPMTIDGEYENYILASDEALLKASSDDVEELLAAGLLPDHTQNLRDPIYGVFNASKVNFVGFTPPNEASWQESVMQLNAALGSERRGDLHIVVIEDSALPSSITSDTYADALKAYWLNNLDKYAFGKNGIMVVIGIDDQHTSIEWARAATGMPVGNGSMISWLEQTLMNEPFTLDAVMGETYATVTNEEASYVYGEGHIPQAVLVDFPFERQCMQCEDDDEGQGLGFKDLTIKSQVEPWGYVLTIFLQLLIAGTAWFFFCYFAGAAHGSHAYAMERAEREQQLEKLRAKLQSTSPWHLRQRKDLKDRLNRMDY